MVHTLAGAKAAAPWLLPAGLLLKRYSRWAPTLGPAIITNPPLAASPVASTGPFDSPRSSSGSRAIPLAFPSFPKAVPPTKLRFFTKTMANFSSSGSQDKTKPDDVLQFWYKDVAPQNNVYASKTWFKGGPEFDAECTEKFGECLKLASSGALDGWMETVQGRLALVIVLDQLSRNVYRGSPSSFAQDPKSLEITNQTIEQGLDKQLKPWERWFLYLPLMHSENLEDHKIACRVFKELSESEEVLPIESLHAQLVDVLNFEKKHHDVIVKYGRYPGRNAALGRSNTKEEEEYLATGGGF